MVPAATPSVYIDAHAHLDAYGTTANAVADGLRRLQAVTLSVAMDPASYRTIRDLAESNPHVIAAFGIHPWRAPEWAGRLDSLQPYIDESPLLGEVGLDFRWVDDPALFPAQRRVFEFFLSAAAAQGKIVNLHTPDAEQEVAEELRAHSVSRSIVHWYSGPQGVIPELAAGGAYFTVGVEVLCSDAIRAIAAAIPEDRLLTETDNPGGMPWLTGEDGKPEHLPLVVEELARIRGLHPEEMRRLVQGNFERLIAGDALMERLYGAAVRSLGS